MAQNDWPWGHLGAKKASISEDQELIDAQASFEVNPIAAKVPAIQLMRAVA